jgi:hypothetical protein
VAGATAAASLAIWPGTARTRALVAWAVEPHLHEADMAASGADLPVALARPLATSAEDRTISLEIARPRL